MSDPLVWDAEAKHNASEFHKPVGDVTVATYVHLLYTIDVRHQLRFLHSFAV